MFEHSLKERTLLSQPQQTVGKDAESHTTKLQIEKNPANLSKLHTKKDLRLLNLFGKKT